MRKEWCMEKIEKLNYLNQQIDVRKKALAGIDEKLAEADELEAKAKALREEAERVDVKTLNKEIEVLEELKKDYEEPSEEVNSSEVGTIPEDPSGAGLSSGGDL